MNRMGRIFITAFIIITLFPGTHYAQGISVDAGLTPPKGRYIIRTMMKSMQKAGTMNGVSKELKTFMYPLVVVYGLKSNVTIMARQMMISSTMKNPVSKMATSGLSDLFLDIKYKFYRKNTESYTLGIAPTLGGSLPTGEDSFTSNTFDLQAGLYTSFRKDAFGADFNMSIKKTDLFGKKPDYIIKGNEISWDLSFGRQFSLDQNSHVTLASIVEVNFIHIFPNTINNQEQTNTGETVVFLSPGFKLTTSYIVFEALLQPVISQRQKGMQLERKTGILLGLRFLF